MNRFKERNTRFVKPSDIDVRGSDKDKIEKCAEKRKFYIAKNLPKDVYYT